MHIQPGQAADFVDQEQVRRFADRDRQRVADLEKWKNQVFFEVFPRQHIDRLQIGQPRIEFGVRHAIDGSQAFADLILGAEFPLDDDLAQQLAFALVLLFQGELQLLNREEAPLDQDVSQPRR